MMCLLPLRRCELNWQLSLTLVRSQTIGDCGRYTRRRPSFISSTTKKKQREKKSKKKKGKKETRMILICYASNWRVKIPNLDRHDSWLCSQLGMFCWKPMRSASSFSSGLVAFKPPSTSVFHLQPFIQVGRQTTSRANIQSNIPNQWPSPWYWILSMCSFFSMQCAHSIQQLFHHSIRIGLAIRTCASIAR